MRSFSRVRALRLPRLRDSHFLTACAALRFWSVVFEIEQYGSSVSFDFYMIEAMPEISVGDRTRYRDDFDDDL